MPPFCLRGLSFVCLQLATLLLLLACSHLTRAAELQWDGGGGANNLYDTPANWDPDQTPTGGDNVTFSSEPGGTVILGAPSVADDVLISAGVWNFIGGNGTSLTNNGTVTIDALAGATLLVDPTATLTGPATWTTTSDASVGQADLGVLNVEGGGQFTSRNLRIGEQQFSLGTVTVEGLGSRIRSTASTDSTGIFVGADGVGTLNVMDGGLVDFEFPGSGAAPNLYVGDGLTSDGTLNISGAGSRVFAEDAFIGRSGLGTVSIADGGFLDQSFSTSPNASVGTNFGASGDIAISGDNSRWQAHEMLIGDAGLGTLIVIAGGEVSSSAQITVGDKVTTVDENSQPSNGIVIVSGVGSSAASSLSTTDDLTIGNHGQGRLLVDQGGSADVGNNLVIGQQLGNDAENRVTVDGAGSIIDAEDVVFVGLRGKAELEITGGGTVVNARGRAASLAGSHATVTIRDAGSTWNSTDNLFLGVISRADVSVENGGLLQSGTEVTVIGSQSGGDGRVTITGVDNRGTASDTADDVRSELRLQQITGADLFVGGSAGQTAALGKLEVLDGGLVRTRQNNHFGTVSASDGWLRVSGVSAVGQRSEFLASDGFSGSTANDITNIGQSDGTGRGRLEVTDGGFAQFERLVINNGPADATRYDAEATPFNETVLASGASGGFASELNVVGRIEVGSNRAASLRIEAGARAETNYTPVGDTNSDGFTIIGNVASADGSSAVVTGAGTVWRDGFNFQTNTQQGVFIVGNQAANARLDIDDGALVQSGTGIVALGSTSTADVLVSNGARWETNSLTVAERGSADLEVRSGGQVEVGTQVTVGRLANSDGFLRVANTDSTLTATTITVAEAGGSDASLLVQNGGTVATTGDFNIAASETSEGFVEVGSFSLSDVELGTLAVEGDLNVGGTSAASGGGGLLRVPNNGLVHIDGILRVYDVDTGDGSDGIRTSVQLTGGTIETADLIVNGERDFDFGRGTLRFTGDKAFQSSDLDDILSNNGTRTLFSRQELAVVGNATLNLPFSAPLRIDGGTLSVGTISPESYEFIDFDSGTLNFTGSGIVVGASGVFGNILIVDDDQTIVTSQTLAIQNGALATVAGGRLSAQQGGTNDGTLFIAEGNADFFTGFTNRSDMVLSNATLTGTLVNEGNLTALGFSTAGELQLTGDSVLSLGINGTADFDSLRVDTLTLGGVLDLSLSGFDLEVGDSFAILEVLTSLSGTFDGLADGDIVGTFGGIDLFIDYNAGDGNDVFLTTILPMGITGDYNDDGVVDAADYTVWRQNLGTSASLPNDATPGSVTEADYLAWRSNYGMTTAATSTAAAAVPEPSTLLLLLTFWCYVVSGSGRSRKSS